MKKRVLEILDELLDRYPQLLVCKDSIIEFYNMGVSCYDEGGTVLICGNGGSAADAEHIVGELLKGFLSKRTLSSDMIAKFSQFGYADIGEKLQGSLPAISLVSQSAITTAFCNDVDPTLAFAQQVMGYNNPDNLLIGISTSGNSLNIINAVKVAKVLGIKSVSLGGRDGGELAKISDVSIIAPEQETFKIQELHLPIYHAWCAMIEAHYFVD